VMVVEAVAAPDQLQTAARVLGERFEHVIEELDVRIDLDRAAVKRETQIDLRLLRRPFDQRAPLVQVRALPAVSRPRSAIGSNGCTSGPV
jgi:hypothetical protein